jgi:ankyrin repeat protein
LHPLAGYNAVEELQREIAAGLDVNEADNDGMTPLHHACIEKSFEAAKILLEAGAIVDVRDKWGGTALGRAVYGKDGSVDLVRLLVEYGADPTVENNKGNSPLTLAQRTQKADYLAVFGAQGPQT